MSSYGHFSTCTRTESVNVIEEDWKEQKWVTCLASGMSDTPANHGSAAVVPKPPKASLSLPQSPCMSTLDAEAIKSCVCLRCLMSLVHHQHFNMIERKTFSEIHYYASEIEERQDIWHCLKEFVRKAL